MREVRFTTESWKLHTPFTITGHVFTRVEILYVRLGEDGARGHGEGSGVYYLGEKGDTMLAQAESVREALEDGAGRDRLLELLPAGGARNAIDCALWDLEAKREGKTIWELTGIRPHYITTFETVGIGTPEEMASAARSLASRKIKVKLNDANSVERVEAVRRARPEAQILVDVNQGWTFDQLRDVIPRFRDLGVTMIEQPLPRGGDEALEDFDSPVPLCADESCLDTREFEQAARRYQAINIKLDKAGGLTEALKLVELAQARGMGLMVGNMCGTSLAMAPGYVVAQLCQYADLDGALFLENDRDYPMTCRDGLMSPPRRELWG